MADKKISDFTTAGSIADGDYLEIETVAGNSRKVPASTLKTYVASSLLPGGRLTLVSGVPVARSDQLAKTSVYYTPYLGNMVPIYSGSAWAAKTFAELTMSLDTTNQLAEKLHDMFVWDNAGSAAIGAGPAWAYAATVTMTIATPGVITWTAHGLVEGDTVVFSTTGALPTGFTAGTTYYVSRAPTTNTFNLSTSKANAAAGTLIATSGSQSGVHTATNATRGRGTGAGTTEIELKDGIWTNKNSITLTNGAGAGTSGIAANTATYVGTVYMTANGQTAMVLLPNAAANGSDNALGVYNAYNRLATTSLERDSTASWTYATATWRSANGSILNRVSFVDGLGHSTAMATCTQVGSSSSSSSRLFSSPALNKTTDHGGVFGRLGTNGGAGLDNTSSVTMGFAPVLGFNYVQAVEYASAATATMLGNGNQGLAVWIEI